MDFALGIYQRREKKLGCSASNPSGTVISPWKISGPQRENCWIFLLRHSSSHQLFAIQLAVHGPLPFSLKTDDGDLLGLLKAAISNELFGEGVKHEVEIFCHPRDPNRNGINS